MKEPVVLFLLMTTSALHAQFRTNDTLSLLSQSVFTVVERDSDGGIKSVRYATTDPSIPATAHEFFINTLKKQDADDFILNKSKDTDYGMRFERYQQYYHGIIVEDGHYNFRFKNGKMRVVKGHYVHFNGIDTNPSLKEKEAIDLYTSYLGIDHKDIIKPYINLMIKEIPDNSKKKTIVALTYRVFLHSTNRRGNYVGYIDAHTGKLLYKEDACIDYSTTGQFYTYYNRDLNDTPKYGVTEYSNNIYTLEDYTRGNGIKTSVQDLQTGTSVIIASDNDNIWTRDEMGTANIALDVHWAMEQIYDMMYSLYNHDGYDGNSHLINSYIFRDTSFGQNAFYSSGGHYFGFGTAPGNSVFGPFGSVDIIGHEYGHALLFNTSQFASGSSSDMRRAIHEGLADIWGVIFENHITPNADCWKTGEQVMINNSSCLRNFQNPNDMAAYTQISSTYGHGAFYSSDPHIAGGLFPHWFYLLTNGGVGINEYNNNYQLIPIGFNLAEELFVNTTLTSAYLEDCEICQDVKDAFIDSALDMGNDFLAEQVQNAWYAVGLSIEPTFIHLQSYAPGAASYFVNCSSNCSISWSITNLFGSSPAIVPNSNNHSCTVYASSSFSGNLNASISSGSVTVTYSRYISGTGNTPSSGNEVLLIDPIDETHYYLSIDGEYENGYITVYNATNLQMKTRDRLENTYYLLDTSSWEHGLYIVEMIIGNKKYAAKISVK